MTSLKLASTRFSRAMGHEGRLLLTSEAQIEYLLSVGAVEPAQKARERVLSFIDNFLARYPKAGRFIPEQSIFEVWVPRTKYVLMYRIENTDVLRILALFHTSQDRSTFAAGEDNVD